MATTRDNLKKVDAAIEELHQATVPVAHQVFNVVQKSVAEIGSVVQLMDANVDRIGKAAVDLGHAQAELTASTVTYRKSAPAARRSQKKK